MQHFQMTQLFKNCANLWNVWWRQLHIAQKKKEKKKQKQAIILLVLPVIIFFTIFTRSNIQLLIRWFVWREKVFQLQFFKIHLFWDGWKTTSSFKMYMSFRIQHMFIINLFTERQTFLESWPFLFFPVEKYVTYFPSVIKPGELFMLTTWSLTIR